jgi:hypothetical protein
VSRVDSPLTLGIVEPGPHRQALLALYQEVLQEGVTEEQFRWKYEQPSCGPMVVAGAWDATPNGPKLAAAFSAYPRRFLHRGRVVTVFQDADAMVDAAYRGRGLFGKLTDLLNAEVGRAGAPFHFGYSNRQSSPLLARREDVRILRISKSLAFPVGFRNAASEYLHLHGVVARATTAAGEAVVAAWNLMRRHHRSGGLTMVPVESFTDEPVAWSHENAAHYSFFPLRDREFLQWRTIDVPARLRGDTQAFWFTEHGRRVGYCVLYSDRTRNILKVLDVVCERPKPTLCRCVAEIRAHAIRSGYDAVTTNIAGDLHQGAFVKAGFWPVASIVSYAIITDPELMAAETCDGRFWLQMPIDRDNIDY